MRTWIAESRMELDQVRLLVLQAAQAIDSGGPKQARKEVSFLLTLDNGMLYLCCQFGYLLLHTNEVD